MLPCLTCLPCHSCKAPLHQARRRAICEWAVACGWFPASQPMSLFQLARPNLSMGTDHQRHLSGPDFPPGCPSHSFAVHPLAAIPAARPLQATRCTRQASCEARCTGPGRFIRRCTRPACIGPAGTCSEASQQGNLPGSQGRTGGAWLDVPRARPGLGQQRGAATAAC